MTHQRASLLIQKLGNEAARRYLRRYFANTQLPTDPAIRRLEFARFFFPDAFNEDSPDFHIELFRYYASGINTAIAAPRGHAKTTVSSTEVLYRIVNVHNHCILIVSDTYSQARDIVDNIRGELEGNALLLWVYGDYRSTWHWTSGSFTTSKGTRVVARGANMKVRGLKYKHWRPDFCITDDLENDEAVAKPERREKLMNWVKKALMPAMAKRNSQICLVGTVLHDDSLLNNALLGEQGFGGWQRQRYAAIQEDGTALWPHMFPIEDLVRMRDDPTFEKYLGPIVFAQEMQNEAVDDRSRIIKREWIYGTENNKLPFSLTEKESEWTLLHPDHNDMHNWVRSTLKHRIMAVDPAISEKTTADYFAIVVIGVDVRGHIYVLDVFRDRIGDIDVQVNKIIEMANEWQPDQVKIEAVAYQAGLARAVQRKAAADRQYLPIFPVVPDKDKFRRAVIHSANFAGGLVHLRSDHPMFELFIQEILNFPVGRNDDMFDAYMHAAEKLVKRPQARAFTRKPRGM